MRFNDTLPNRPGRPALGPIFDQFAPDARRRLRIMARTTTRHADLIAAFPALALALSTARGGPDACARAQRMVREGAPLATIAREVDVPLWWRKLPANALPTELGPAFSPQNERAALHQLVPTRFDARRDWFAWVNAAGVAAPPCVSECLALWVAHHVGVNNWVGAAAASIEDVRLLAAFVLAVSTPGTPTHKHAPMNGFPVHAKHIQRLAPWRVAERIDDWLNTALNAACLAPAAATPVPWRKTIKVDGYKFAPRVGEGVLIAEGELMDNCLSTYAGRVDLGEARIYAVRRGGRTVGSLELAPDRNGRTRVVQLSGPSNGPVAPAMRAAADRLAARLGAWPEGPPRRYTHRPVDQARWRALWEPSWDAIDGLDRLVAREHSAAAEERLAQAVERFFARS